MSTVNINGVTYTSKKVYPNQLLLEAGNRWRELYPDESIQKRTAKLKELIPELDKAYIENDRIVIEDETLYKALDILAAPARKLLPMTYGYTAKPKSWFDEHRAQLISHRAFGIDMHLTDDAELAKEGLARGHLVYKTVNVQGIDKSGYINVYTRVEETDTPGLLRVHGSNDGGLRGTRFKTFRCDGYAYAVDTQMQGNKVVILDTDHYVIAPNDPVDDIVIMKGQPDPALLALKYEWQVIDDVCLYRSYYGNVTLLGSETNPNVARLQKVFSEVDITTRIQTPEIAAIFFLPNDQYVWVQPDGTTTPLPINYAQAIKLDLRQYEEFGLTLVDGKFKVIDSTKDTSWLPAELKVEDTMTETKTNPVSNILAQYGTAALNGAVAAGATRLMVVTVDSALNKWAQAQDGFFARRKAQEVRAAVAGFLRSRVGGPVLTFAGAAALAAFARSRAAAGDSSKNWTAVAGYLDNLASGAAAIGGGEAAQMALDYLLESDPTLAQIATLDSVRAPQAQAVTKTL